MPVQEQAPQQTPANPEAATTAPAAGDKSQVILMRKNLVNEIKELKKQVLLVQLQSMKVMQQSIHSLFKAQTDKTSEQIALQSTDLQKNIADETEAMKTVADASTKTIDQELAEGDEQMQAFNDIVYKAMNAAQQSVDSAMMAAQKIMRDAENILKGS